MLSNASPVEITWTIGSLIAMVLHGWLSAEAWLDWKIAGRARAAASGQIEAWRQASAGWYLLGQVFLFIPQILHLAIGVVAMTLPPSQAEQQSSTSSWLQVILIAAEWQAVGAAGAFWMARRVLTRWVQREDAQPSPVAAADHRAVLAAGAAAAAVKAAVELHEDSPEERQE